MVFMKYTNVGSKKEVNTNTPLVKGYFETISATKINFYDGRIITRVSDPISNKNITCESGYAVRTYKYGENSNYQVDLNYKVLILEKIVAHENNTNIDYASLQEAIDSANSTDITLKGAVTETINIPDNYTVKIEQGVYDMRRY